MKDLKKNLVLLLVRLKLVFLNDITIYFKFGSRPSNLKLSITANFRARPDD
jgi:hypothetical protein